MFADIFNFGTRIEIHLASMQINSSRRQLGICNSCSWEIKKGPCPPSNVHETPSTHQMKYNLANNAMEGKPRWSKERHSLSGKYPPIQSPQMEPQSTSNPPPDDGSASINPNTRWTRNTRWSTESMNPPSPPISMLLMLMLLYIIIMNGNRGWCF